MASKSVWGAPTPVPSVQLADVMSEQLAVNMSGLDSERDECLAQELQTKFNKECSTKETDDFLIAKMLQSQFDREHNKYLQNEENAQNGKSKVSISYSKYKIPPSYDGIEDESSDDSFFDEDERKRDWDAYETADRERDCISKKGYVKIGGKLITKHDSEISSRSNGKRIMEFPPGIETGDGGGFDMQLSNSVYNGIRNFSLKEGKRRNKVQDKEDKATKGETTDPKTKLVLYKWVNGGLLESINGIISTGKEATIMHGDGGSGSEDGLIEPLTVPKEVAIKIFKTTLNEFKNREMYIRDDYRFKDRFTKQNPRKVVAMWAEKEMHNLSKMLRYDIRVPEVIMLKDHVILMSFIGENGVPAPKLKDAIMTSSEWIDIYKSVISTIRKLYNEVHLVHADLSEYNILWYHGECVYIDVSQAVEPNHPHGLEFLYRDIQNIVNFFGSKVPINDNPDELFSSITSLTLNPDLPIKDQIMDLQLKFENFDSAWIASKSEDRANEGVSIPGHQGSQKTFKAAKSPKSPKSPGSVSSTIKNLAALNVKELQEYKDSVSKKITFDLDNENNS